jgi:hypothetical protein
MIFLNELERSLDLIKTNPHQYQVRYKQIRMTKVRRFPICLHYLVREEEIFVPRPETRGSGERKSKMTAGEAMPTLKLRQAKPCLR